MERCCNCGANLRLDTDRNMLICPYCESVFYVNIHGSDMSVKISSQQDKSNVSDESLSLQLIDISMVKQFDNEHNLKSFTEMCAWINEGKTVENCLKGLRDISEQRTEWAMYGINPDLLNKVKNKLSYLIGPDEHILFFKDSGFMASGKSGLAVTNQSVFCFDKKSVNRLLLKDIYSIHALSLPFASGMWYFNTNRNVAVDNIACSASEQGLIMALICLLIKRHKGNNFKIKLRRGVTG